MKIGTMVAFRRETLGLAEGGEYQFLAECGFDSVDFSLSMPVTDPIWQLSDMQLKDKMLSEKFHIENAGLCVAQTHSPYDYNLGCAWMQSEKWEDFLKAQVQAICWIILRP